MRKLLAKIRKILRDRRTRRFLTRFVSGAAAIVVFVTTYALVLPAITMEKEANCGIEAHQHDDSCYTGELICDIPESGGHHHDESCYSITSTLICGMDEHEHSVETGCYDEDGNLICEKKEHRHNDECYEETRELTCQIPESEGHQHTDECYEKVLTCGKEAHVHSTACYEYDFVSDSAVAASTSSASAAATSAGSVSSAGMTLSFVDETVRTAGTDEQAAMDQPVDNDRAIDNNGFVDIGGLGETDGSSEIGGLSETERSSETASSGEGNTEVPMEMTYGSENAGTGSTDASNAALTDVDNSATALTSSTAADQYIPSLEAVDFNTVLNDRTGIYYHHVADGETVEDSSAIPAEDWNRIPNNTDNTDLMENMDDVELGGNDLLRVYLSYTIPAGSLNATNPVARYRLPSNLHLTDSQVKAINENVNGLAGQYVDLSTLEITDPDMYNAYLGVEAVEGTRRPDEAVEDYLAEQARKAGTDPYDAAEYISAAARVENVYDADGIYGEKDAYLGQDLIFTFAPYSIEKNQHEYDSKGQPIKAGQEIEGWLILDLNMGQVDFGEAEITTSTVDVSEAEDVEGLIGDDLAEEGLIEDDRNEDERTEDGRIEDDHASEGQTEDDHNVNDNNAENSVEDKENNPAGESGEDTENPRNNTVTIERAERTAEIVFVEEGRDQKDNKIDQISTRVTVVEKTVIQAQDNDNEENSEEPAAENTEEPGAGNTEKSAAGSTEESVADKDADQLDKGDTDQVIMPAMSFTDSIRVSTGKPAGIDEEAEGTLGSAVRSLPQEAEVSVRVEADEGTFPAGTTMVLKAVEDLDAVAEAVTETVENSDPSVSADGADHQSEQTEDSKNNNGTEEKKNLKTYGFQAVDITFLDKDGKEIQPAKPVRVAMTSEIAEQVKEEAKTGAVPDPVVVHVDDDGNAEQMELVAPEEIEPAQGKTEKELLEEDQTSNGEQEETETTDAAGETPSVGFTADSFSVYAIVYTVDFHWEVNGKTYDFSIPGGGFVSFEHLVEVLGITSTDENTENRTDNAENGVENGDDFAGEVTGVKISGGNSTAYEEAIKLNEVAVSEAAKKFVADVESVEFSRPELVWVGKVGESATISQLKDRNGLQCVYSAELTEDQIAKINGSTVEAGDWALISVLPFTSVESLTVTMNNGDQFVIRVTDWQISTSVLTADGKTFKITASYNDAAEIPAGTKLVAEEIAPGTDEFNHYLGLTWTEVNKEFLEQWERLMNGDVREDDNRRPVNIDIIRFFDITFEYMGREIEPKAPVHVDIQLEKGLSNTAENPVMGVVHFPKEQKSDGEEADAEKQNTEKPAYDEIELIESFNTVEDGSGVVGFSYDQESFSVVGAYIGQATRDAGMKSLDPEAVLPKLTALRSSDRPEIGKVDAEKKLRSNSDGTYTLSLSVKGNAEYWNQMTKANVLIMMDRSTSMNNGTAGSAVPLAEGETPQTSGVTYYGYCEEDGKLWPLNYVSTAYWTGGYPNWGTYIDTGWKIMRTGNDPEDYSGTFYTASNRIQAEQAALDALIQALVSKNNLTDQDTSNDDIIEVLVASFASARGSLLNGAPCTINNYHSYHGTITETGWENNYGTGTALYNAVHDDSLNNGTNWEDALRYAKQLAGLKKEQPGQENEDIFIIFLTDGEPTAISGEISTQNNGYGAMHFDSNEVPAAGGGSIYALGYAKHDDRPEYKWDVKEDIVDEGYKFYSIFTFNDSDKYSQYLKHLVNYAYGVDSRDDDPEATKDSPSSHAFFTNASNTGELLKSFDNIWSAVFDSLSHGDVKVVDGLTTDAMSTNIEDGEAAGVKYTVKDGAGKTVYTVTATGPVTAPTSVVFHINGNDYEGTPVSVQRTRNQLINDEPSDPNDPGYQDNLRSEDYTGTYYHVTVNGIEYRMALADAVTTDPDNDPDTDNDERTLIWDLSPIGSLTKGYTYTAEVIVWPNQDAYDYVAGLNNHPDNTNPNFYWNEDIDEDIYDESDNLLYSKGGVKEYPSIVRLPDGSFDVLTNTDQKVYYSEVHSQSTNDIITDIETTPTVDPIDPVGPMDLLSTKFDVKKVWNDTLDPAPLKKLIEDAGFYTAEETDDPNLIGKPKFNITLRVKRYTPPDLSYMDDENSWDEYMVFTFYPRKVGNNKYVWDAQELNIASGVMVTENPGGREYSTVTMGGKTYYMLETGHDYKITEDPFNSYNFEFQDVLYHPMRVDGVLKNVRLTLVEEYDNGTAHYTAEVVNDTNKKLEFVGSNNLRSGMNIIKKVQDIDGRPADDDTTFYVRLYANDADGEPLTYEEPVREDFESDEAYQKALQDYDNDYPIWYKYFSSYTVSVKGNYTGVSSGAQGDGESYSWPNGEVKAIKAGELLQLINIPYGTQIRVVEVEPIYDNEGGITGYTDKDVGDTVALKKVEGDNTLDVLYKLKSVTGDVVDNAGDNGYTSIGFDKSYEIIFTNKPNSADITVKKVEKNTGRPLRGAAFTLTKAASGSNPGQTWVQPAAGQPDNGTYSFNNLPAGNYTLEETAPPAGYDAVTGTISFTVDENGTIKDVVYPEDDVSWNGRTATFTVQDTPSQPEPGKITVRKEWLDADGNPDEGDGDSITVALKRKVSKPQTKSLKVELYYKAYGSSTSTLKSSKTWTITNSTATVKWTDNQQFSYDSRRLTYPSSIGSVSISSTTRGNGWDNDASFRIEHLDTVQDNEIVIAFTYNPPSLNDETTKQWFQDLLTNIPITINAGNGTAISAGSGEPADDDAFNNSNITINLTAGKGWAETLKIGGTDNNHAGFDYPEKDDSNNKYYYYIEETPLPNCESPVYYTNGEPGMDGVEFGILTVTNKKNERGSLAIRKLLDVNAGAPLNGRLSLADGKYNFTVLDNTGDTVLKYVQIRYRNGEATYAVTSDGDFTNAEFIDVYTEGAVIDNLPLGTYVIKEEGYELDHPTGYEMELSSIFTEGEGAQSDLSQKKAVLIVTADSMPTAAAAYTNTLVPLLDVPVEKVWDWAPEDARSAASWSAEFELEYREVLVSGEEASDAKHGWAAYKDREGHQLSVTLISTDSDASEVFHNLPMYNVHDNGSVYRMIYALNEVEYTIEWNDGTPDTHWVKDPSHHLENHYSPDYEHDAGEGDPTDLNDWYKIILTNAKSTREVEKSINVSLQKTWDDETVETADNSWAKFRLMRKYHEEWLEFPANSTMVIITLDLGNGQTRQMYVPQGKNAYVTGVVKPGKTISLSFSNGITLTGGETDSTKQQFIKSNAFLSDNTTISFTGGDTTNLVGGLDGIGLASYDDRDADDRTDNSFGREVTLNASNGWRYEWADLPQVVEEEFVNGDMMRIKTTVYSYYLVEEECYPRNFSLEIMDDLGMEQNPFISTAAVLAENKLKKTDIEGDKIWDIEGNDLPADPIVRLWRRTKKVTEADPTAEPEEESNVMYTDLTPIMAEDGHHYLQPTWTTGTVGDMSRHYKYEQLPAEDPDGNEYVYTVEEIEFKVGNVTYHAERMENGSYRVTMDSDDAMLFAVTQAADSNDITNGPVKATINILKVDENNNTLLPGATFRLFKYNGTGMYVPYTKPEGNPYGAQDGLATGDDGVLTYEGLPNGAYRIVELLPPPGYLKMEKNDIYFDVLNGTVTRYDKPYGDTSRTVIAANQETVGVTYTMGSTGIDPTFIVENTPGAALPYTGGPGTRFFTILGSILIAGAGLLLWRRRRTI